MTEYLFQEPVLNCLFRPTTPHQQMQFILDNNIHCIVIEITLHGICHQISSPCGDPYSVPIPKVALARGSGVLDEASAWCVHVPFMHFTRSFPSNASWTLTVNKHFFRRIWLSFQYLANSVRDNPKFWVGAK